MQGAKHYTWKTIQPNVVVSGVVNRILRHGLFVSLDNSSLKAFVDQKECSDTPIADLSKVYAENDRVKLLILRVDAEKHRIDASMRSSLLPSDTPFTLAASLASHDAPPSSPSLSLSDDLANVPDFDESSLQPLRSTESEFMEIDEKGRVNLSRKDALKEMNQK